VLLGVVQHLRMFKKIMKVTVLDGAPYSFIPNFSTDGVLKNYLLLKIALFLGTQFFIFFKKKYLLSCAICKINK
jgi:hypothetical protein